MDLGQFRRLVGLATAALALAATAIWFATGAVAPASMYMHDAVVPDYYIEFQARDEAQASRIHDLLKAESYPTADYTYTGRWSGHDIIVLKPFMATESTATVSRLSKELGSKDWNLGTLQEMYQQGDMARGRYSFGRMVVLSMVDFHPAVAWAFLLVMAVSAAAAAALGLLLLLRGSPSPAILWLGLGLGCWSLGVAYIWIYSIVPVFAAWQPPSLSFRFATDVAGYLLLLVACQAYVRFWKGFPQPVSDAELDGFLSALKEQQFAKAGLRARWLRFLKPRQPDQAAGPTPQVRVVTDSALRGGLKQALAVLVTIGAGLSWTGVLLYPRGLILPLMETLVVFSFVVLTYWPGLTCLRVFRYHRALGTPEDCRKIEWIWASIWMGFVAVMLPLFMLAVIEIAMRWVPALEELEVLDGALLIFGLSSGPLFVILALAISILYRGNIDPRLALRGVTLWSVLGVVLTLLFVFIERSVAVQIAKWWHLSPQTGYITAGAIVAATFQPVRKRTETYVNRFVERVLPADLLSAGTRRTQAVAVVDISGYTALSAKDEQSALVASALVQKEARRLAEREGGRVVKSTGDGVILCFDEASKALDAVAELHRAVRTGAATLNLPGIALHSGLHWGEVVEMRDGDIYGMTVNLAARLADWAQAGEIGVSRSFHDQLADGTRGFQDAGPQAFKNVPEPIGCLRLSTV